jgi:hypothetical protein
VPVLHKKFFGANVADARFPPQPHNDKEKPLMAKISIQLSAAQTAALVKTLKALPKISKTIEKVTAEIEAAAAQIEA